MSEVWQLGPHSFVTVPRGCALADAIDVVFHDARAAAPPTGRVLELSLGPGGLLSHGLPIVALPEQNRWAPLIEGTLVGFVVRTSRDCAALHAATLEVDGNYVLLLGAKGSGKSTLSAWIGESHGGYLGDEIALLRFDDRALWPLPKAATLKTGAFSLFSERETYLDPVRGPVRYVRAPIAEPNRFRAPPSLLIHPRYTPGHDESPRRLEPGEAALQLVEQSFGGLERSPAMLPLIAALSAIPTYFVSYRSSEEGLQRIRALVAAHPGGRP